MKKTLLTLGSALLLITAWPVVGAEQGSQFRCGMHLGGKGMTYQPSLGWKKSEPARRSRSVLMVTPYSDDIVFSKPYRDMTLTNTSQEFRYLRGDLRAPRPLALAKAGCTWR